MRLARTETAAAAAARELGFPVVIKAVGPTILHKTEVGGVRLNLADEAAVRAACRDLKKRLGEDLTDFLVQAMVPGGVEVIAGVTNDSTFGPLVLYGSGGTLVELLADVAFRLQPLTDVDVGAMLDEVRGTALLRGYRGAAAARRSRPAGPAPAPLGARRGLPGSARDGPESRQGPRPGPPGRRRARAHRAPPGPASVAADRVLGGPVPATLELAGLSASEARERLARDGPNEIAAAKRRGVAKLAGEILREPMILLLVASGAIYFALGDPAEAAILLASILAVIGISLLQTRRTERSLEKLRDLSSPRARVIRDSVQTRIAGREVVRGDLLVVSEGDRVAADGEMRWLSNLSVDESLLTGESVPVAKRVPPEDAASARDGASRVFAGTLVVSGQGLAEVTATGPATEMGRIGQALRTIPEEKSPLQREIGRIVRRLGAAGLAVCVLIVALLRPLARKPARRPARRPGGRDVRAPGGVSRGPHGVPGPGRVEDLSPARPDAPDPGRRGARRRHGSLRRQDGDPDAQPHVRSAPGRRRTGRSRSPARRSFPRTFTSSLEFAILASQRTPFDPMEQAIRELGLRTLARTEHLHEDWELLREYPLSPELLAVSHAWKARGLDEYVIAAKGAPEAIADLCHLPEGETRRLTGRVEELARDGLRVLAVAKARFHPSELPPRSHDFPFELLGLLGLEDPLRPSARTAIEDCRTAGIRVVMITGDYPVTAARVAREIGLPRRSSDDGGRARCARRRGPFREARRRSPSSRASCPRRSSGSSRPSRAGARSSS